MSNLDLVSSQLIRTEEPMATSPASITPLDDVPTGRTITIVMSTDEVTVVRDSTGTLHSLPAKYTQDPWFARYASA